MSLFFDALFFPKSLLKHPAPNPIRSFLAFVMVFGVNLAAYYGSPFRWTAFFHTWGLGGVAWLLLLPVIVFFFLFGLYLLLFFGLFRRITPNDPIRFKNWFGFSYAPFLFLPVCLAFFRGSFPVQVVLGVLMMLLLLVWSFMVFLAVRVGFFQTLAKSLVDGLLLALFLVFSS
ncbi:MAG TPA: hypothetical protein P5560_02800 [Thermotogota bacterium]|nr:hypothetical protein [Thermotogota bacterium]HRW91859.1 hypothetical protein [Thermotogota bacterium]